MELTQEQIEFVIDAFCDVSNAVANWDSWPDEDQVRASIDARLRGEKIVAYYLDSVDDKWKFRFEQINAD